MLQARIRIRSERVALPGNFDTIAVRVHQGAVCAGSTLRLCPVHSRQMRMPATTQAAPTTKLKAMCSPNMISKAQFEGAQQ